MRRILEWTPRGDSLDPLVARWHAWRAVWAALWTDGTWWRGAGPGQVDHVLGRYAARTQHDPSYGAAFNEPLQLWHDYGVCGLAALALFLAAVLPHLRAGDPWSAAWVIGAVLSLGHWPLRLPQTGVVWLAISARLVLG